MANYEFTVISNDFKVKKPQEVLEVFLRLGYEKSYCNPSNNTVCLASYEECWDSEHRVILDKNNNILSVINSYEIELFDIKDFAEQYQININEIKTISITEYIQHQLIPNSYFAVKEVGNEKLRYNIGYAEVITKNNVKWFNLDRLIETYVTETLSDTSDDEVQLKV